MISEERLCYSVSLELDCRVMQPGLLDCSELNSILL